MIYFDSAATTFQKPRTVADAMRNAMATMSSPGRGGYPAALRAAEAAFDCRPELAELYHLQNPEQVVFTLNATHALNIALKSLVPPGGRAVVSGYDFTQLPDFGETLHQNIHNWFQSEDNWYVWYELRELVHIAPPTADSPTPEAGDNPFVGKTVVVTGKVEPYNRDEINAKIEALGAHAGSSVSSKTDYLICGENAGSKLAKAQELGIKILSPDEFFRMAGESA